VLLSILSRNQQFKNFHNQLIKLIASPPFLKCWRQPYFSCKHTVKLQSEVALSQDERDSPY
jgi:hypothetical protein